VTDAGARVRSTLTTLVATLKKRGGQVANRLKQTLDVLARNLEQDPYSVLFPPPNPRRA